LAVLAVFANTIDIVIPTRVHRRGICFLPAAEQQIPRAETALRNDNSWGPSICPTAKGWPGFRSPPTML